RKGLSDHDTRVPHADPVPHELEAERRYVHEDVRIAELARDPPPALEVQLDLSDPPLDRYIQLGQGRCAEVPIRLDPVPLLEAADRFSQRLIEFIARARRRAGGGVALCAALEEAPPEEGDPRSARARRELRAIGDHRPSARRLELMQSLQ